MSKDIQKLHKYKTHKEVAIKFILLLAILIAYFGYLSYEYGITTGGIVAALTWSFFVFCTPIADAGFLLDFPIRLLFGIRMIISELIVWTIATGLNIYAMMFSPEMYQKTFLTSLLKKIILTPYPYWSIIILSSIGTFLSIYFGDEILDVFRHKDRRKYHQKSFKLKIFSILVFFILIFSSYYYLLENLDIKLNN